MIQNLLLNSCWDYTCIVSSQLYDMLTFNDMAMGIWLWLMYPLAFYGIIRLFGFDIPKIIKIILKRILRN